MWTDPWRGLSLRERWRLARLTRSGKQIIDPKDAMQVREYIFWSRRVIRRFFRNLSLISAICLVLGVIKIVDGHPFPAIYWATLGASYGVCGVLVGWRGRRETRTSVVNGWEAGRGSTG